MNALLIDDSGEGRKSAVSVYTGASVNEFISYYAHMPDVWKYATECYNGTKLLQVFKDFIHAINITVKSDVKLPSTLIDQRSKVVNYIEQYIFMKAYP